MADQTTTLILPATNEALWAVVPPLLLLVLMVGLILIVRYVVRLRRSA